MAVSRQIPFSSSSDPASDRHPSFADVSLQEVLQLKLWTWVISTGSIQSSSKINNLIQFSLLSLFIFWWEPKGNNFLSKLLPPKRRSVKKCQGIARDQIPPNQRIRIFFNKKYITRANRENSWNQLSPHLKKRWEGKTNRPSTEHYLHCLGVGKQRKTQAGRRRRQIGGENFLSPLFLQLYLALQEWQKRERCSISVKSWLEYRPFPSLTASLWTLIQHTKRWKKKRKNWKP